ncbi:MAG: GGDEF domain-containing protein [Gemmatimonadaceae bacterium]|nr:GGDEF domain-containing protein [Gemmatimonadaceae bacterium]
MDLQPIAALLITAESPASRLLSASLAPSVPSRLPAFTLMPVGMGDDALVRLSDQRVDVVLLDLTGPLDSAMDLLIRARVQVPEVPVVVLVEPGHKGEANGAAAIEAGACDSVVKEELSSALLARVLHYAIERYRLHTTLDQLSLTDALTGLYNARGFRTLAEHHLKLAHRTRGLVVAVADVRALDRINVDHGRDAGDRALVAASQVMRETFRASDVIARIGNDDFAALMLDAADDTTEVVAPRLRMRLEHYRAAHRDSTWRLSMRVGIARVAPGMHPSIDELLAEAAGAAAAEQVRVS